MADTAATGIKRKIKRVWVRFVSLRGRPEEIALGFALGLFVGMSPYFMCHTVTAVFLASLLKWNKLTAAAGVFITNPVTAPFFYHFTYLAGKWVLGISQGHPIPTQFTLQTVIDILKSAPEILWILTVGGIITGLPIAAAGYYLALWSVMGYRRRRSTLRNTCNHHR